MAAPEQVKARTDSPSDPCDRPLLSVVIPTYNEESTIGQVLQRVASAAPGVSKEIIVSNDGSSDGTARVLRDEAAAGRIVLEDSPVNRGKGAALRAGLRRAKGEVILIQDADLEMNPDHYPALIAPILSGDAEVVYGSRFAGRLWPGGSVLGFLANKTLVALTNLLYGSRLTDVETCYKVFRAEALSKINLACNGFDFEVEVSGKLLRAGFDIHEVPVSYQPRSHAQGKKVRWPDAVQAAWVLARCRFAPMESVLASQPEAEGPWAR